MQFHKEINDKYEKILSQLQEEREEKKRIEAQLVDMFTKLTDINKKNEDLINSYSEKISALEMSLNQEINSRKKLAMWIKENIGENLEHLQKYVTSNVESIAKTKEKVIVKVEQSKVTEKEKTDDHHLFSPCVYNSFQFCNILSHSFTIRIRPRILITGNDILQQLEDNIFGKDNVSKGVIPGMKSFEI